MRDTIAAISTPLGAGGLGVIRISGPQARAVAAPGLPSPWQKVSGEDDRLYLPLWTCKKE